MELNIDELNFKYQAALNVLDTQLKILIKDYEISTKKRCVEHYNNRIKDVDSAIDKLKRKKYDVSVESLNEHIRDMVGVRLVCPYVDDVYEIVDLIRNSNLLQICEEEDYIKNPKESGYTSYHMNVMVPICLHDDVEFVHAEIQIRTLLMDAWAALEHDLIYKNNGKNISLEDRESLKSYAKSLRRLDNKMLTLKKAK